jgi:hypothetical protein
MAQAMQASLLASASAACFGGFLATKSANQGNTGRICANAADNAGGGVHRKLAHVICRRSW